MTSKHPKNDTPKKILLTYEEKHIEYLKAELTKREKALRIWKTATLTLLSLVCIVLIATLRRHI